MSQRSRRRHSRDGIVPVKSGDLAAPVGKSSPLPSLPRNQWIMPVICVFLAIIVWVVFGQTLHHEFIDYDDDLYVYENATVTTGLTLHGITSSFSYAHTDNWVPLTAISHMVDWQFYGRNAGGHHLTNVLLHAANVILLFLVLGSMTGAIWRSAFVAAVFAVHPLHVESVAWVAERKDVLSGLFFMLTLWAYTRYAQPATGRKPKSKIWYCLALFFFALGLMSKPMLVTLPFVLLLMDYWPLKRVESLGSVLTVRGLVLEKVPFLVLSVADCVATVLVQKNVIESAQHLGFFWRAGNAMVAYAEYIWEMIYPAGLAALYPLRGSHLPVWEIAVSVVLLLVVTMGVLVWRRSQPCLATGWLWYLGMLVPVIGLVQVGYQARADRYTYLPQIGLYILLTWGAAELCRSWRYHRAALGTAAAVVLVSLTAAAYVQTGYWKNSISLWTHTLACTTENSVAHYNFGYALADQGKWTEAVEQYRQALQINPDYIEAHNNLGLALAGQGKLDEAIEEYKRSIQIKPENAEAHNNLGLALAGQGKLDEAIEQYRQALQIRPDFVEARVNLGLALARQGKWTEAIGHYEQALQINPKFVVAHIDLGVALAQQGKLAEAIEHFMQALQIKPDNAQARYDLGIALARQGKVPEAAAQFHQALDLAVAQNNIALANAIRALLDVRPSPAPQPQPH